MTTRFKLAALTPDDSFQPRNGLNVRHVDSMVKALKADPATFDGLPIKVWKISESLTIVDGFHRFEAFSSAGFLELPVEIHETKREEGMSDSDHAERARSEALQYAIKANQHNGSPLRRTQADNQRAIRLLLENPVTRKHSDVSIAEMVGVRSPTVAKIRKEKPEFQTDERIGSDGRKISRERMSSNTVSKRHKQLARAEVASLAGVAAKVSTMGRDMVEDHQDFSGTRPVNDAALSAADAEEVSDFREKFNADFTEPTHPNLDDRPTTRGRNTGDDEQELSQMSHMTEARFSAADASELRLFREHFAEIRQLGVPYIEEFMINYTVDLESCKLSSFGIAIFKHIQFLNGQVAKLKMQLEKRNSAAAAPAKPAAKLRAKTDPALSAPEESNSWEE